MAEPPLLYLLRHGETESNRERRFAGWNDEPLMEGARGAVRTLARALGPPIGRIYTSPVRRAAETAEILSATLSAPVRTVHDLHEIEVGEWKGLSEEEVEQRWPDAYRTWRGSPDRLSVPGRETLEAVQTRATRAVDQIGLAELSEDAAPALVVTHLAVIRAIWLGATRRPLSEYQQLSVERDELFPVLWCGRGKLEPGPAGPVRVLADS